MKDVYGKIYDIMYDNLGENDEKPYFSRKALMSVAENSTLEVDISLLKDLDNEEFLQASYMSYFNRVPDKGAISGWKSKLNEEKEKFHRELTNKLIRSFEFKINNSKVINNIYETTFITNTKIINNKFYRILIMSLYVIYGKTLRPLKIKIKNKLDC